jgi:TolB protein
VYGQIMKAFPVLAILLLGAALAPAADITVTQTAGQKTSIDLSGLRPSDTVAQTFVAVLEADLLRSGWFSKGAPGQGALAIQGSVAGTVRAECRVQHRFTQREYLAKAYTAEPRSVRRLAHQVADDIILAFTGAKGMNSGRIALVGNRTGRKEIYLCDPDGENMIQLTQDNKVSLSPNWSPGGRQLVYTSYLKGYPDIYLIELATGRRQRIAAYPGLNTGAAFSPDGSQIALILSKDGNPDLYVKGLSGGIPTRLTSTKPAAEASPCWSPDGSQIVFVSDRVGTGQPQLYSVSRGGGEPRRLTSRGSQNVDPDWGPNGLITYSSLIGGKFQICVVDPRTLDTKQVTSEWADFESPTWAPDGRHILCSRTISHKSQLVLVDMMGDAPFTLTKQAGDWYSPAWSK